MTANSVNPDEHGKVIGLADATGLPADAVRKNVENIERTQQIKSIDYQSIQERAPSLANFLVDPQKSTMIQDEVPFWQKIEEYWSDVKEGFERGTGQGRTADLRWRQIMAKVGINKKLTEDEIQELEGLSITEGHPADDRGFFAGIPIVTAEQLPIFARTLSSGIKFGVSGLAAGAGTGAVGALIAGQLGPQVALPEELVTVPVAATGGAVIGGRAGFQLGMVIESIQIESGLAFDEYINFKDLDGKVMDEDVAAIAAVVTGMANGALEFVGNTAILKNFPGINKLLPFADAGQMKKMLASQTFRSVLKGAAKRFAKTAAVEGTTEALQELVAVVVGEIAKSSEEGDFANLTSEEIVSRVVNAGYRGAQGGIGLSTPGIGVNAAIDARRVSQAQKHKQFMSDRIESILGSKLSERSPRMMEELYQSVADSKGQGDVFISAGPVINQLQKADIDPVEFFEGLGVSDQELFDAVSKGADVSVKSGRLVTALRDSEFSDLVLSNIRQTTDAMTSLESEDMLSTLEADAKRSVDKLSLEAEVQQEMENIADEVFDSVVSSISEAGVEAVEGQSLGVAELYRAYALRQMADWAAEGKEFDAKGFYEGLGLTFVKETDVVRPIDENISEFNQSGELITDSDDFRNFFEGSEVVDDNNDPLTVFHGTSEDFDSFDKDFLGAGEAGFWFAANPKLAQGYANSEGGRVISANISAKKVFFSPEQLSKEDQDILNFDLPSDNLNSEVEFLISRGFDAKSFNREFGKILVFNQDQIKISSKDISKQDEAQATGVEGELLQEGDDKTG